MTDRSNRPAGPIARLADKIFRRHSDILLNRTDERHLHPARLLRLQAQTESAEYAKANMSDAIIRNDQTDVLDYALSRMPDNGSISEFGVGDGESIRFMASRTDRPIHGFDSFEGLPEDWPGRHEAKGHYSTGGRLPSVPAHVSLHKGWFEDTLPGFLEANSEPAALIHMDCDLYSSTKTVLELMAPRIVKGTVIAFDEYFNFVSWREHEHKAFQEFVAAHGLRYRYVCWGFQQAVVVIGD